ncbi:MAG: hypothetical protein HY897_17210 [Deltaproteobacteria bacterium]|nr:hypothetical protein [Deltaproteobacteria bacterium]
MPDGRIFVAGRIFVDGWQGDSYDRDNGSDLLLLGLSDSGKSLWQSRYGHYGIENANSIRLLPDGNFFVSGTASSYGGGAGRAWVIKLRPDGAPIGTCVHGFRIEDAVYDGTSDWPPKPMSDETGVLTPLAVVSMESTVSVSDVAVAVEHQCGDPNATFTWHYSIDDELSASHFVATEQGYSFSGAWYSSGSYDVFVSTVDSGGTPVWGKTMRSGIHDPKYDAYLAYLIASGSEGGIVVAFPTPRDGNNEPDGSTTVARLSPAGDVLSSWRLVSEKPFGIRSLVGIGNDQFVLWGDGGRIVALNPFGEMQWAKSWHYDSVPLPFYAPSSCAGGDEIACVGNGTVSVFGPDGNLKWARKYQTDFEFFGLYSATKAADGGYVAVGFVGETGFYMAPVFGVAWVLKLDSSGNVEWSKSMDTNQTSHYNKYIRCDIVDARAKKVVRLPDEGFAIHISTDLFGVFSTGSGGGMTGCPIDREVVIKLDSGGSLEWARSYGTGWDFRVRELLLSPRGGLTLCGAGDGDVKILDLEPDGSVAGSCPNHLGRPEEVTISDVEVTVTPIEIVEEPFNVTMEPITIEATDVEVKREPLCVAP